jgi:hypothetical protein
LSLPPALDALLGGLEQARMIAALRNSTYVYPLITTSHLIGMALLFGAIVPLDLQLAGWRRSPVRTETLARLLIPIAVAGLAVAISAGLLLFATDARAYAGSTLFQIKMVCVGLALCNAVILRRIDWQVAPSRHASVAGFASAALWLAAIVLGRMTGFF